MRRKKILAVAFFAILVSAMLILPKSLTITSGAMKTSDILGDPKVSNEILSQRVQQEFSETALEYLVNKPTDPAINKTIIDPNPERSIDYTEKEPNAIVPDLNETTNIVLYTNTSIISFSPPTNMKAEENNDNANDEDIVIDAWDPNRPPAAPLPVTKEGHWFPNMDHSRIRYEVNTPYLTWFSYQFRLDISRGDDPYARYFRIYWDGNLIHDQVIGGAGYHSDFWISAWPGSHRLEFEIWSGYYSDHAWKIDSFRPVSPDPLNPLAGAKITAEFFPFTAYGRLRLNVYMGQQTQAEVKIESVDDPYLRDLKVFVDGVQKYSGYAPCDITINLGSYTHGSLHEIMLEVSWCDYKEWGYKMPKFRVHYGGAAAEIDYLYSNNEGYSHRPSDDILNYIQVWYVEHGYQRYYLFIDDAINADGYGASTMTDGIYNQIMNDHFDLNWMYGVKYVLVGHYDDDGPNVCGWADVGGERIFIADQACADYAFWNGWVTGFDHMDVTRVALMHECGHSINIYEGSGGNEQYCSNTFCVMAMGNVDNCGVENSWYCQTHWNERDFPDF
jgi:hypothetical protein